jgi:hypothetical protein
MKADEARPMFDGLREALWRALPTAFAARPAPEERRRHARHRSPALTLVVEGHRYKTLDWSLGGFRIAAFHRPLAAGMRIEGTVRGVSGAKPGEFLAEVARVAPNGIGLRLIEIASATFVAMAGLPPDY